MKNSQHTGRFVLLAVMLVFLAGFSMEKRQNPADIPEIVENRQLKQAVQLFRDGSYAEAARLFGEASVERLPAQDAASDGGERLLPVPKYNQLTALALASELEQADEDLQQNLSRLDNRRIRAMAAYNLGSAYLSVADAADKEDQLIAAAQQLDRSIHWLKESLLAYPSDTAAKNNLEYALKLREKLQEQQEQQDQQDSDQQQDENKQDREGNDQENQKDQQNQQEDDKKQGDEGNDQQNQQQQNKPQESDQQQEQEISEATAKNLLQAAKDAEKQAIKMMREKQKRAQKKQRGVKDW